MSAAIAGYTKEEPNIEAQRTSDKEKLKRSVHETVERGDEPTHARRHIRRQIQFGIPHSIRAILVVGGIAHSKTDVHELAEAFIDSLFGCQFTVLLIEVGGRGGSPFEHVEIAEGHTPLTKVTLGDRLSKYTDDTVVTLVALDLVVERVDRMRWSLKELDKRAVAVEQEAGDALTSVVGARSMQDRFDLIDGQVTRSRR